MATVKFTKHLQQFFPGLDTMSVSGGRVRELIRALDERYPGLAAYLVDDQGALRKHVNIFVNGELINDRRTLQDSVTDSSQVYILQALSGG